MQIVKHACNPTVCYKRDIKFVKPREGSMMYVEADTKRIKLNFTSFINFFSSFILTNDRAPTRSKTLHVIAVKRLESHRAAT